MHLVAHTGLTHLIATSPRHYKSVLIWFGCILEHVIRKEKRERHSLMSVRTNHLTFNTCMTNQFWIWGKLVLLTIRAPM